MMPEKCPRSELFLAIQPFLHSSQQRSLYFTTGRPFPLKIALRVGSGPPSNTRLTYLGQPEPTTSISSTVFAGLTIVTDRPTDHATPSVTIGRIYS